MLLIGESLNVISKKIGAAYKQRDPKPIQEEALFQREKGMDYIDINLGPAKKDGHELMPWVVKTVQEVVDDVPLALDTSNIDAISEALKVYKDTPQPPLINSIMVRPERYEPMVPIAAEHNADFIALMWGPDGLPRDENERAALCVELLYFANEMRLLLTKPTGLLISCATPAASSPSDARCLVRIAPAWRFTFSVISPASSITFLTFPVYPGSSNSPTKGENKCSWIS